MEPKAIISLLAIVAGLFGIFSAHRLSAWRSKKNFLRNEVIAFKSAFASQIAAIADDSYRIDTFSSDFSIHEDAVNKIRPILPQRYRRKLEKAWDDYRGIGSKYEDIGFDAVEFVSAMSSTPHSINDELFNEFKKNFKKLHTCLDSLLK